MPSSAYVRIIPCLDVRDGRVVKGVNFTGLTDAGDPVEIAARYSDEGADELVLLDITATTEGRGHMIDVARAVANRIQVPLTIGGGLRTLDDIQQLLDAGADKVSIGSAAIREPELIRRAAERFGSQRIIVAIDARSSEPASGHHWEVLSHGGSKAAGLDAVAWARQLADLGAGEVLLTSMDRDGTKDGFDLDLTRAVADAVTLPVIASGGAGTLQHLADAVIRGHAQAVLAASIFHFGEFSIAQAKDYLTRQGIATSDRRDNPGTAESS